MKTHLRAILRSAPQLATLAPRARRVLSGYDWRSHALTFVCEMAILVLNLATLRLAARLLGPTGFGEYAISKRAISVLAYPLLVGLGISLPRYLAEASVAEDPQHQVRCLLVAAGAIIAPILLGFAALTSAVPRALTDAFFGGQSYDHFAGPIALAVVGLCLQTGVYGYYRGRRQLMAANAFRLLTVGVVPPVMVLVAQAEVTRIITLIGAAWMITSLALWVCIATRVRGPLPSLVSVRSTITKLASFGIVRVPAEFALFGFFSLPVFIAARRLGIEHAGTISVALSLMQVIGASLSFIGIALLPEISSLSARRMWSSISGMVKFYFCLSLSICIFLLVSIQLFLSVLISFFAASSGTASLSSLRLMMLAVVPYNVYLVLRNPLDAISTWPHNSANLVAGLCLMGLLLFWGTPHIPDSVSILSGFTSLGVLTLLAWRRAIRRASSRPSSV